MGRLFGTDGVRGVANGDLTPQLAMSLSLAAVGVLTNRQPVPAGRRPLAVVGRDPRASGEMLEAATVAGLTSAGADVLRVGVLPTPAVAYFTSRCGADLGVMLSASHNPMPDNGVKFFARGGEKLADVIEDEIEARLFEEWDRPTGTGVGRVQDLPDAAGSYVEHLLTCVPQPLTGLRVVVDCAHGAAAGVAPVLYRKAGAEVLAIGAEPDGENINDGFGSTAPDALAAAVVAHGADVGIAHDGDADRCVAVDAVGRLVDGDAILAVCALALREKGRLRQNTVVTTVMTNLGFKRAMTAAGITVVETQVGDRYVLEEMRRQGLSLGGEQSGHLVFLDHATTGDGLLTALHLLSRMVATGRPLADLATVVERLPQVLRNVAVVDRDVVAAPAVAAAVAIEEERLGTGGRVLLRPSGTERVVRVMVEAVSMELAEACADRVAAAVAHAAGG
ncbi:MAG: phosphoglucosamine mutase [Mycobacteriales bacterium]